MDAILVDVPIKNNFSDELIDNSQYDADRIYSLEKKIAALEDELDSKDMIIREDECNYKSGKFTKKCNL